MVGEAEKKVVHRAVPITSKLVPRGTIPPIGIESTVGEEGEFRQNIELENMISRGRYVVKNGKPEEGMQFCQ
jgi:hypothetical protein